jgi:hypothetical protein
MSDHRQGLPRAVPLGTRYLAKVNYRDRLKGYRKHYEEVAYLSCGCRLVEALRDMPLDVVPAKRRFCPHIWSIVFFPFDNTGRPCPPSSFIQTKDCVHRRQKVQYQLMALFHNCLLRYLPDPTGLDMFSNFPPLRSERCGIFRLTLF